MTFGRHRTVHRHVLSHHGCYSFDPAAEKSCEELLNLAQQTDPGNTEAWQALASVRLSQQRPEEAKQCLEQAWVAWKDLDLGKCYIVYCE